MFSDQTEQWNYEVDSMPDPTFGQADTNDASLENFFSRPIKVASYEWGIGVALFQDFNPWSLYFENPRVINRIANYNLLRAKLKVRIVINGNGFHYGRAIASYLPLHNRDEFSLNRALISQDVIQLSQQPHVYLDPTKSQGGTLTLPFFYPLNALNIPESAWQDMGTMNIREIVGLKHANGATDTSTISVFVWAEDVSLSVPTSTNPTTLSPQAGGDEYSDNGGPISGPAGVIARAAHALTDIPVIGVYARATELAASATAGIAKLFGYSRPVSLEQAKPFTPRLLGNMANTNVEDQSNKLTFDVKQELSIDPRTMGLGSTDEMSLMGIATRESYLTGINWLVTNTAEDLLWNCEITPVIWAVLNTEVHMPACCFAALPFRRWRGSMKYRFQVVASNYHKGRLRISYDPYSTGGSEYNTQYTHVIDLAKERDFTIKVGWGHERALLNHKLPGLDSPPYVSGTPIAHDTNNTANGTLSVRVVNDLTVPNTVVNNDIVINVFVSACEDFEVFDPDGEVLERYTYRDPAAPLGAAPEGGGAEALYPPITEGSPPLEPQAGEEVLTDDAFLRMLMSIFQALLVIGKALIQNCKDDEAVCTISSMDGLTFDPLCEDIDFDSIFDPQAGGDETQPDADLTTDENVPVKMEFAGELASAPSHTDCLLAVYYGDPIKSLRQCLKRYNFYRCFGNKDAGHYWAEMQCSNFPPYNGYDANGMDLTDALDGYNYCKLTLLNYVTPAFVARRGGIRWKYEAIGNAIGSSNYTFVARRIATAITGYYRTTAGIAFGGSQMEITRGANAKLRNNFDGAVVTPGSQNNVLEFECPYFANTRFDPAKQHNWTSDAGSDRKYHWITSSWKGVANVLNCYNSYVATGEDFTLNFFTGAPIIYYSTTTPAADPTGT